MGSLRKIDLPPDCALYVSGSRCGACQILLPQIKTRFQEHFPALPLMEIAAPEHQEWVSQQGIFVFPSLMVFLEGKETLRKVPFLSFEEIKTPLTRLYTLLFLARR